MTKYFKYVFVGLLFFLLVLVRALSSKLFYDPLYDYFKSDYLHESLPALNLTKLVVFVFFRYLLNSIISIGIIYLLFQKQFLKFSLQFYSLAFVVLSLLLVIVYSTSLFSSPMVLFYIRRFLIHPIFVLLLIPAFYYQNKHA